MLIFGITQRGFFVILSPRAKRTIAIHQTGYPGQLRADGQLGTEGIHLDATVYRLVYRIIRFLASVPVSGFSGQRKSPFI